MNSFLVIFEDGPARHKGPDEKHWESPKQQLILSGIYQIFYDDSQPVKYIYELNTVIGNMVYYKYVKTKTPNSIANVP